MIYYITGGERSGKSRYAQELALKLSDNPIYIATSRTWDADFEKRVQRHKDERDERWTSVEEEKQLSKIDLKNKVAVVDCVTLWLTNFYLDTKFNLEESLGEAKIEFEMNEFTIEIKYSVRSLLFQMKLAWAFMQKMK